MPGADGHGQREDGGGLVASVGGGCTLQPLQRKVSGGVRQPQTFRSNCKSALGDDGASVFEGDGRDFIEEGRGDFKQAVHHRQSTECPWAEEERKRERRSKDKSGTYSGGAGGGVKVEDLRDEDRLHEEITFQGFLSCFIRWILRSRTVFATFLARSFHAQRSGASPATAVFPLPIPFEGLFGKQRSPKLSRSQLRKLCIKRAIHVVVIALNYIHNGMRPISVNLLGRRPSLAQLSVFRRLRALITACDLPEGQYPLPPGRSGFEFIARIVELEKFSAAHPAFNFDYGTSDYDEPKSGERVGTIKEEHHFIINEKFSPLQPYRALDASRLKLSRKGQYDMQNYIHLQCAVASLPRSWHPMSWTPAGQ